MSAKVPACHNKVLHGLHTINDALKRDSFIEAIKHAGDNSALIQNEREWCYDSDATLKAMYIFMCDLIEAVSLLNLLQRGGNEQTSFKEELIKHIDSTVNALVQVTKGMSHWQEPDTHLDLLEKEHRINKYKG